VDCLDALASDRQYRRALPLDEAMNRVKADAGTAFDPKVVQVLGTRYVELEQMAVSQQTGKAKLSTDVKVERGLEPAAGFEKAAGTVVVTGTEQTDDFLTSIASARQEVQQLFELAQDLGKASAEDASDGVGGTAGRERDYHGDRSRRPVLRSGHLSRKEAGRD